MDSLDSTARRDHAEVLAREGILDRAGLRAARLWIRAHIDWIGWVDELLLGIGASLLVAGLVGFFTINWAWIPTLGKFALLEATIAAGVLATWRVGLDCRSGKMLLTGCSVLVGALLAVYEMSYPVGKDDLNLLLLWAALISGWVAIGRFSLHWMLLVAILNVALEEILTRYHVLPRTSFGSTLLGLLNGGFLLAAESGRRRGMEWLDGQWHRVVLWGATVCFLSTPAMWLATWRGATRWEVMGSLVWLGLLRWGYRQYRTATPDLTALAIGAASVACVAQGLVMRWLFDGRSGDEIDWLIAAMAALAITGGLGTWLRSVARDIQEVARD